MAIARLRSHDAAAGYGQSAMNVRMAVLAVYDESKVANRAATHIYILIQTSLTWTRD